MAMAEWFAEWFSGGDSGEREKGKVWHQGRQE
jgi:hypothetical protein